MCLRQLLPSITLLGLSLLLGTETLAQDKARFITVDQGKGEFRGDEILAYALTDFVEAPTRSSYDIVIQDMIDDADPQGTIARMTPYAFVVAEMRGAKLDLIATYESKSSRRTMYNAYLVIRRANPLPLSGASSMGASSSGASSASESDPTALWSGDQEPTLGRILDVLIERGKRGDHPRFVYHTNLSTSSYFLPSLLFRSRRIFALDSADEGATIIVEKIASTSSSDLVREVADGRADLASVWDGTVAGFRDPMGTKFDEYGRKVWFLRLPTDLPCDLLVATKKVDDKIRDGIRARLAKPLPIEPVTEEDQSSDWDVASWVLWSDPSAEVARSALSVLRRRAAQAPSPVVVSVMNSADENTQVADEELEAVRQAIRLSGTEFVARGEFFDYYKHDDVVFYLERIHDGAIRLRVIYQNFKLENQRVEQRFDISFVETADLTRRVGSLIHSRLHRIRPIWLYQDRSPTVIRDVDFEVSEGARLPMFIIKWNDPARNDFTRAGEGLLTVKHADFHKFEFVYDDSVLPPRVSNLIGFDPMGRTEYRVLLMREKRDPLLFRVLTASVVLLSVLALVGVIWDLRRVRASTNLDPTAPLHTTTEPAR